MARAWEGIDYGLLEKTDFLEIIAAKKVQ